MAYFDREEIESALEVLEDIENMLDRAVRDASENGIIVSVDDHVLHMRILELREQLAEMDEADRREMNRSYERMVAYV